MNTGQDEHSCRGKNKNCMYIFCASFSHHTGGKTTFTRSLPIFTLRNDQREDSEPIKPKHINHILLQFLQQIQVSVNINNEYFILTIVSFTIFINKNATLNLEWPVWLFSLQFFSLSVVHLDAVNIVIQNASTSCLVIYWTLPQFIGLFCIFKPCLVSLGDYSFQTWLYWQHIFQNVSTAH